MLWAYYIYHLYNSLWCFACWFINLFMFDYLKYGSNSIDQLFIGDNFFFLNVAIASFSFSRFSALCSGNKWTSNIHSGKCFICVHHQKLCKNSNLYQHSSHSFIPVIILFIKPFFCVCFCLLCQCFSRLYKKLPVIFFLSEVFGVRLLQWTNWISFTSCVRNGMMDADISTQSITSVSPHICKFPSTRFSVISVSV